MAKRRRSKRKGAKARKGTFSEAVKALGDAGVPNKEFGQFNADGTVTINQEVLEDLRTKFGKDTLRKVRFVALNAPFKRRSQIPPA
jgi:hypothetical protein